jgi:L-ascorbate metabolism protein UlaG (beta-lactamase superfamily)
MALTEFLILRKPRSGCLEERTALIQPIVNSFTRSYAGMTRTCGWLIGCAIIIASLIASTVQAACTGVVAGRLGPLHLTGGVPEGAVSITFLGHASFLIESPAGVRIVTDYNDAIRAAVTPDIVTMNNAHPTHYSEAVEPGVKYVLRGWDPAGGVASHHLDYRDVRIRNVPTNVRELGGTRYNGNSIFVFEVADLCVAHLGHLHHTLTEAHLAELGPIDVVMVPVDGTFTLNQEEMIEVLRQIGPKIVIPMHIFSQASLEKFLTRAGGFFGVHREGGPAVVLSRAGLPATPEILVLAGR